MDREADSALVRDILASYRYEPPPPGSTIGVPMSADEVYAYVEKLKAALVPPYLQRFKLDQAYEQIGQCEPSYAEFRVVAEAGSYLERYDPTTGEFGLGQRSEDGAIPVSIGVRGDLVGVFCAM